MIRASSMCALALLVCGICGVTAGGSVAQSTSTSSAKHRASGKTAPAKAPAKTASAKKTASRKRGKVVAARGRGSKALRSKRGVLSPRVARLTQAFTASEQLRPMAQQLAASRSPQAYSGVRAYAAAHPGEAAAAAFLSLGHAHALDRRYPEAIEAFRVAGQSGDALDDYAVYLGAQAAQRAGQIAQAAELLRDFATKYPDSIFAPSAPLLQANLYLQGNDAAAALRTLTAEASSPIAGHADYRLALGRAYQQTGDIPRAAATLRDLYTALPLSRESATAAQQLAAMGSPLTPAQRKVHADRLFNAKRYGEASAEYLDIKRNGAELSAADHDALEVYAAVCDLKLKRISRREAERLPAASSDGAAARAYILAELSRTEGNRAGHDALVNQMVQQFPTSRWLEEGLYSGGNMYLLLHDSAQAIYHYDLLVRMFPESTYAPSAHWRTAWMNYRLRRYDSAARLMEEQIQRYGGGIEIPSALYWRGRIYEDEEKDLALAASYYRTLAAAYPNFYYALLARQRLSVIGEHAGTASPPLLQRVKPADLPELTGDLPEDDPHLIKARLLANAALNEYIGPEIQASDTAGEWGALAQAEIYSSFGETTRSLQSMKHSGLSFFALPFQNVPRVYWELLFPRPYWSSITQNAQANGLDSYLVASLIRQESEFNAGAVSHANAYGLMQLLPSVGKSIARKHGIKGFSTAQLLAPAMNVQLGCINLREVLDRYGGQVEYALAAYNAGDVPVRQWLSSNDYKDVPEFVESIPYTETREYVQAILRNREMYRLVATARAQ